MPSCANCGKVIGLVNFCPECGTRTKLETRARLDRDRYESFRSAVTETYSSEQATHRLEDVVRRIPLLWLAIAACTIVVVTGVLAGVLRKQPTAPPAYQPPLMSSVVARHTIAPRTPAPKQTPAPTPTPAPTSTPSPQPTSTTAPSSTPSAIPTASLSVADAPALVRSNAAFAVGKKGSCTNNDAAIDTHGYTRGCTLFGLVSTGALANGKGTVLVVPVSTSEDIQDTAYGLVYLQSGSGEPRFLGFLAGDGTRPLTMRVEDGLIVLQTGAQTAYFTFDGHRIVQVSRGGKTR